MSIRYYFRVYIHFIQLYVESSTDLQQMLVENIVLAFSVALSSYVSSVCVDQSRIEIFRCTYRESLYPIEVPIFTNRSMSDVTRITDLGTLAYKSYPSRSTSTMSITGHRTSRN